MRQLSSSAASSDVVIVFDFDGTLYSRDSFAGLFHYLFRHSPWRLSLAMLASPILILLWLAPHGRDRAVSVLLWLATLGLSTRAFNQWIQRYVASIEKDRSGGCFYSSANDCLMAHQAQGHRVIIISATGEPLLKAMLALAGLDVEYIGSKLARRWGGIVCTYYCYGINKVFPYRELTGDSNIHCFYTDSRSDYPLMRISSKTVLVNFRAKHQERIKTAGLKDLEFVSRRE